MITPFNGQTTDALRAHRLYDFLIVSLQAVEDGRETFVRMIGDGAAVIALSTRFPGLGSPVFLNRAGIWAVGFDPATTNLTCVDAVYAATARLKQFLVAHYASGSPGPEIDQHQIEQKVAIPLSNEKAFEKSTVSG